MKKNSMWFVAFLFVLAIIVPYIYIQNNNLNIPTIKQENSTLKLYYYNQTLDPNSETCAVNDYLEISIDSNESNLQGVLDTLMNYQAEGELKTQFPSGFSKSSSNLKLTVKDIQDGVATIEVLDPDYFTSGGSCYSALLSSQIRETAIQLPDVESVVFTGEDYIFQP
jgi:spore germination protein GerM